MAQGTYVGNLAQDTTTTTGTGAITLANTVPAGAPANTTTFAVAFAAQVAAGYPVTNIFYYLTDGSNVEVGLGTLTSATNFTRDFVVLSGTTGAAGITQNLTGTHINFAAGTKTIYSNPALFAATEALWQRVPNQLGGNDGGLTEDIMSGTFTATINAGSATSTGTVRYKVSSSGICTLQIPTITATAVGTTLTLTGIPSVLSNVTTSVIPALVVGTSTGGVVVPGFASLAGGATPTSTGTMTLSQYTSLTTGFSNTFTTAVVNGITQQVLSYPLF
jgi:hypothetical protein